MAAIRPLVAGNWKMNGLRNSVREAEALAELMISAPDIAADAMICPPATLLTQFAAELAGSRIALGGQDCHTEISGAHTGDLAAEMLADAGASAAIVGHSERRADHGEGDEVVRAKAQAAHRAGLTAIICVGETEDERKTGETLAVVGRQIAGSVPAGATAENTIIAYEPVWAIGTGLTPTVENVEEVHSFIRSELETVAAKGAGEAMRILYGGSVKPDNAAELMAAANVDGALVGGASLKADDFYAILSVYRKR
jgi:triosephosphate isomerase